MTNACKSLGHNDMSWDGGCDACIHNSIFLSLKGLSGFYNGFLRPRNKFFPRLVFTCLPFLLSGNFIILRLIPQITVAYKIWFSCFSDIVYLLFWEAFVRVWVGSMYSTLCKQIGYFCDLDPIHPCCKGVLLWCKTLLRSTTLVMQLE